MLYKIKDFKVLANNITDLKELIQKKYHLNNFSYRILSRSIDARNKENVYLVYDIMIDTKELLKGKNISSYELKKVELEYDTWTYSDTPIIVGFGPAGIFAALYLARCHANPIIIERGSKIEERMEDVSHFLKEKQLNPNSNIQFGEGGAGAFSDGKLTTNVKNPYNQFILEEFVSHGGPEDILYDKMPHIGTDILREVIKNIRLEIESLGGKFYFNTTFKDFKEEEKSIIIFAGEYQFRTKHLLLGIGHSAKDTIRMLYNKHQIKMEAKAFSMGVRIEHQADKISVAQYGKYARFLPKAYYKLAYHMEDRGVYTFCMCPGGYVMASASEEETIVTNGMSNYQREGKNSNSAILVDVRPSDYGGGVLDGLKYQELYEHLAFNVGGKNYQAPTNLVKEFLNDEVALSYRSITPSYPHGIHFADLRKCLPDYVIKGIKEGIIHFDHKLHGFKDPDAILIGVETRSSSPVRILRDEMRKASIPYLYPMGEGAGYAGGIMSASLDGLLTAIKINQK
ncbi:MAG: hypothetical protein K2H02_04855 [Anaeroplasmataceae bacterium]|nr:hypothetical protein [Anaeroplasmataceae bacterium]